MTPLPTTIDWQRIVLAIKRASALRYKDIARAVGCHLRTIENIAYGRTTEPKQRTREGLRMLADLILESGWEREFSS